jgi:hypothetical protein
MSLTNGNDLYAALSDTAANKFLRNVFQARPHYFNYATQDLGGGSPSVGLLTPLLLPGVASPVSYSLKFAQPTFAFYPTQANPPAPAPPITTNQFRFYESVTWLVAPVSGKQISGTFEVWAVGAPAVVSTPTGPRIALQAPPTGFVVDGTGNLDPVFTYFGQLVLSSLLSQLTFPMTLVNQGALKVTISQTPPNPTIDGGQLQVWANIS